MGGVIVAEELFVGVGQCFANSGRAMLAPTLYLFCIKLLGFWNKFKVVILLCRSGGFNGDIVTVGKSAGRFVISSQDCFFVSLGGISTGFCLRGKDKTFYNVLKRKRRKVAVDSQVNGACRIQR